MSIKANVVDNTGLTPRQCEILELICEGKPDKVIASQLAISIKTVQAHIEHIYIRLGVRRNSVNVRCHLIATAVVRGIVSLSSTVLCLWIMVSAVHIDHDALRVVRTPSVRCSSRVRDIDG